MKLIQQQDVTVTVRIVWTCVPVWASVAPVNAAPDLLSVGKEHIVKVGINAFQTIFTLISNNQRSLFQCFYACHDDQSSLLCLYGYVCHRYK